MNIKRSLLIGGSVIAVGLSTVGIASAATSSKPSSIVDELSQKFHLNKADVQAVFDQHKQEVKTYRDQNYQQHLSDAVTNGTITSAQEAQILAKHKELQDFMQTLKDKTPAERRQAIQTERQQLQQWAKDNNVPANLIAGFGPRGMGGMHGMRQMQ